MLLFCVLELFRGGKSVWRAVLVFAYSHNSQNILQRTNFLECVGVTSRSQSRALGSADNIWLETLPSWKIHGAGLARRLGGGLGAQLVRGPPELRRRDAPRARRRERIEARGPEEDAAQPERRGGKRSVAGRLLDRRTFSGRSCRQTSRKCSF